MNKEIRDAYGIVLMEECELPDGALALYPALGLSIRMAARLALGRAQETGLSVQFVFNGVPFFVTGKTDPEAIERAYLSINPSQ